VAIDWAKIKSVEDLFRLDDNLYDESPEYGDDVYDFNLNPDLTDEEIEDAMFWSKFMRGIMLVSGPAGSGKGLFAIMLAWKMRYYFGKTIMLDYRPRRIFGKYHPFNQQVLVDQISRMSQVATGEVQQEIAKTKGGTEENPTLDGMTREWIATSGKVFLQNSVLCLDEFKNYMYKRRPHNPMGITLGHIFDIWRHLDILIVGMTIDQSELDRYSCIPKLTTEVRCSWLTEHTIQKYGLAPYSCMATIYPLRYVGTAGEGVLEVSGKAHRVIVEGGKPRERLGGKRWVDLYNTKDAKIIQAPKSLTRKMQ